MEELMDEAGRAWDAWSSYCCDEGLDVFDSRLMCVFLDGYRWRDAQVKAAFA